MRTILKRTQRKAAGNFRHAHFWLTMTRQQPRVQAVEMLPAITHTEPRGEPTSSPGELAEPSAAVSARGDTLRLYLREIGQVKLLTPRGEIELARRIRRGDKMAREEMIKANLRLVVKIAREYEDLGLPLLDLINEGNIGLMKGVERFDPRKGAKLSTYAAWWIKQSMKRALANQSRTIRLPVHAVDKVASIRRAETRLHEILEREPTDEEVANEVGIGDARRVRRYREASRRPVELDAPIGTESDSQPVSDIVADPNAAAPFDQLVKQNDRILIQEAFESLDERESMILMMRFGIGDEAPKTLEEIGQKFHVTRERIRQIQELALKKMRAAMERRGRPSFETAKARAVAA